MMNNALALDVLHGELDLAAAADLVGWEILDAIEKIGGPEALAGL